MVPVNHNGCDRSPELERLSIDAWRERAEFKAVSSALYCPKCGDIALTTVADPSSATEICFYAQCKGTWLATGQFLNLINDLLEEAERTPVPELFKNGLLQARGLLAGPNLLAPSGRV